MSYDLMVFDASVAPRAREAFMTWYDDQTQWTEPHGYNNPDIPATALQLWFQEMIKSFPPLNGPLANDSVVDDPRGTDYALGFCVVYACFAWSQAEFAYAHAKQLAAKHGVGFFEEGEIWFPTPDGGLTTSIDHDS